MQPWGTFRETRMQNNYQAIMLSKCVHVYHMYILYAVYIYTYAYITPFILCILHIMYTVYSIYNIYRERQMKSCFYFISRILCIVCAVYIVRETDERYVHLLNEFI